MLYTILVPTIHANGRPISLRFHRAWDAKVRVITGGMTVLQPTKGQWISPEGELFTERMIPVMLACSRLQIQAIADMTARYYSQKAIIYWKVSDEVVIAHYG